jgi:hypothetical protein
MRASHHPEPLADPCYLASTHVKVRSAVLPNGSICREDARASQGCTLYHHFGDWTAYVD